MKGSSRGYRALPLFAALLLAGCDMPVERHVATRPDSGDDLMRILARGTLRVLRPQVARDARLSRDDAALDYEERLIEAYAHSKGLRTEWVWVDSRADLISSLLERRGDFIAANFAVTPERKQQVKFTVPIATVREQIVSRADDDTIRSVADLSGRTIAVRRSSPFWSTVRELKREHRGIRIEIAPESFDNEEIIRRVADGRYDLALAESNVVQAVRASRQDIKAALDVTRERPVAWAVHPHSSKLLSSLNLFLSGAQLARRGGAPEKGDLAAIRERGVLRVLTRNNAATYFLYRGELVGFEYEFVREFARQQGLELEVVVPPRADDLLPWLLEGRGDLVAAALTPTAERRGMGVRFSEPYNFVSQVVVARADESRLRRPADLAGRRVVVRQSSAYWTTLEHLRFGGIDVELVAAPEEMETAEIIGRVASGEYDLTLADEHILGLELAWRDDVRGVFALTHDKPLAWAVRGTNPELLAEVDRFVHDEYRGALYNELYDRYFRDERRIKSRREELVAERVEITPYDELVRRWAGHYGFDWRLIAAMMYEESRFDPQATSFAGARGLMQVLPGTAEDLGFDPERIDDPETGIHAGVRYLAWVRDRFDEELPVRDRMSFTLAAYNAGWGHVADARRIAAAEGLDPDRWFGHVEQSMLQLALPDLARETRYGYCRCTEPVDYVRAVLARYGAYLESETPRWLELASL